MKERDVRSDRPERSNLDSWTHDLLFGVSFFLYFQERITRRKSNNKSNKKGPKLEKKVVSFMSEIKKK